MWSSARIYERMYSAAQAWLRKLTLLIKNKYPFSCSFSMWVLRLSQVWVLSLSVYLMIFNKKKPLSELVSGSQQMITITFSPLPLAVLLHTTMKDWPQISPWKHRASLFVPTASLWCLYAAGWKSCTCICVFSLISWVTLRRGVNYIRVRYVGKNKLVSFNHF